MPTEVSPPAVYFIVRGNETYMDLTRGLKLNPDGIIVGGTHPHRLIATAHQVQNLARTLKKRGELKDCPFLVYPDDLPRLEDIDEVFKVTSTEKLPMGICTRLNRVLQRACRIYPKEITKVYLLWAGGNQTITDDSKFECHYADWGAVKPLGELS